MGFEWAGFMQCWFLPIISCGYSISVDIDSVYTSKIWKSENDKNLNLGTGFCISPVQKPIQ